MWRPQPGTGSQGIAFACSPGHSLIQHGSGKCCSQSAPPRRARHSQIVARRADARNTQEVRPPLKYKADSNWELDFYSRPVFGSDGKKLWELIVVDSSGTFEHVEAIPNAKVNSEELRKRILSLMESVPAKPKTVRFFRSQMFNMISIALKGLDLELRPSRRTYSLFKTIKDREKSVYPNMAGYRPDFSKPTGGSRELDFVIADRLPDALRCEKFAFGNFPLEFIVDFFATASPTEFFGDACLVDDDLPRDVGIPGVVIFSKRSKALAGWMSGVELAFIKALMEKQQVIMECGLSTAYRFADIDDSIKSDARQFQESKKAVGGLHFLAVQQSEDSDEVDGFWLLNETNM